MEGWRRQSVLGLSAEQYTLTDDQGKLVVVTGAENPLLKQVNLAPTLARLDDDWTLGMHQDKRWVVGNASRFEDY